VIFSDGLTEMKTVDINDLGNEDRASKMPYMKDYDFTGMKICNAFCAVNSRYFAVGRVGEELPSAKENKKKKDKRSALGIFKIDP